ncbi:MAG: hypothetical protein PVI57_14000 [Gemmatimonadota bacterium]|jgi:hypothetical protein
MRRRHRAVRIGALAVSILAVLPRPTSAQEVGHVRLCGEPETPYYAPCVEAALAVQAARAAIGLAAAGGADLAGTNSTLGMRLGSTPRFALGVRVGAVRAPVAILGTVPASDGTGWLPGVRATGAVAVFDGFSTAPTMGGILAVDLLATASWVGTSADDGFDGEGRLGGGVGIRLGVFRESFTLPGVTLTAARRWMGQTRIGTFGDENGQGAEFDNTVTSLRAVIGKELFAVGFLAGVGWERYGGDVVIQASAPATPDQLITTEDFHAERALVFGGLSWNFLVLQLSAEAGWAGGFNAIPDRAAGFDPTRGAFFGAVAFRVIL